MKVMKKAVACVECEENHHWHADGVVTLENGSDVADFQMNDPGKDDRCGVCKGLPVKMVLNVEGEMEPIHAVIDSGVGNC